MVTIDWWAGMFAGAINAGVRPAADSAGVVVAALLRHRDALAHFVAVSVLVCAAVLVVAGAGIRGRVVVVVFALALGRDHWLLHTSDETIPGSRNGPKISVVRDGERSISHILAPVCVITYSPDLSNRRRYPL